MLREIGEQKNRGSVESVESVERHVTRDGYKRTTVENFLISSGPVSPPNLQRSPANDDSLANPLSLFLWLLKANKSRFFVRERAWA